MSFKSGFVAIVGMPNVGKSTLLNSILGEKISIVSKKPQTTRNVIKGIKNLEGAQIVFMDTPGLHRGGGLLNEFMAREALAAIKDIDGAVFMVEPKLPAEADFVLENLKKLRCPVILAINKIDRVEKGKLLPVMDAYARVFPFSEIVPISALTGDGLTVLLDCIVKVLPEGPKYFPEDMITDEPERFIAAEIVREKVFKLTKEEVPYSVAVVTERFEEKKTLIHINAAVVVERESQKAIIIGKGGAMLKKIGTEARADIEKLLSERVFLELFVKVEKDWTKKERLLKEFGKGYGS